MHIYIHTYIQTETDVAKKKVRFGEWQEDEFTHTFAYACIHIHTYIQTETDVAKKKIRFGEWQEDEEKKTQTRLLTEELKQYGVRMHVRACMHMCVCVCGKWETKALLLTEELKQCGVSVHVFACVFAMYIHIHVCIYIYMHAYIHRLIEL
jgi:hypothetical protein